MEQIVIYSLTVQKLLNLKQKTLKLHQHHYVSETFQKTLLQAIYSQVFNEKE